MSNKKTMLMIAVLCIWIGITCYDYQMEGSDGIRLKVGLMCGYICWPFFSWFFDVFVLFPSKKKASK